MQSKDGHVGSEIGVMLPQAEGAPGISTQVPDMGISKPFPMLTHTEPLDDSNSSHYLTETASP